MKSQREHVSLQCRLETVTCRGGERVPEHRGSHAEGSIIQSPIVAGRDGKTS